MYEDLVKYLKEELAREPEERQDSTNRIIKSLEGLAQYQPAFENGLKALAKGVERIWAQAEPGLNDVADMVLALLKAAKDFEDSGALAPLDDLIRKAHECFTRPQDAFGGLSPCEVLSAFQKRAEGELEKIIAMLSAYYALASPSPDRNIEAAAISPAIGANVGSDEIRARGEVISAIVRIEEEVRGLLRQGMAHWENGEEALAMDIFTRATAQALSTWAELRGENSTIAEGELIQLIEHARAFSPNLPEPENNLSAPLFWEIPSGLPGRELIKRVYEEAGEIVGLFSPNEPAVNSGIINETPLSQSNTAHE